MNKATISADIISYTALSEPDKRNIEQEIKDLLYNLTNIFKDDGFFGRTIQGDYIECATNTSVNIKDSQIGGKMRVKSQVRVNGDVNLGKGAEVGIGGVDIQ